MSKAQKTDLVVSAAAAAVLIGLGVMVVRDIVGELKAAGVFEDLKRKGDSPVEAAKQLARDLTNKAAKAADAARDNYKIMSQGEALAFMNKEQPR